MCIDERWADEAWRTDDAVAAVLPFETPKPGEGIEPRPPSEVLAALRPRERMAAGGARALTATDLVALVIGVGGPGNPATAVASRLVRRHGVRGLANLDAAGWAREAGVGAATAARLVAAFELGRRSQRGAAADARPRISRPSDVYRLARDLAAARKEHLAGLYLDSQNGLLHRETISTGSLNTTRTHPREILHPAIAHLALGFVLVHNHPSGCLEPSDEDVEFTRAVRRAAELLGIELYDHVIVSARGFTSLKDRGVL